MIFQHGENSRYGLSAACTLPYVPEYVMIRPAGGTLEMLQALRDAYGPVLRMAEQGEACRLLHRVIDAFAAERLPQRANLPPRLPCPLPNPARQAGSIRSRQPLTACALHFPQQGIKAHISHAPPLPRTLTAH